MFMTKIKKILFLLCTAAPMAMYGASGGTTAAGGTSSVTSNPDALFANNVIAQGKGVSITKDQLDNEVVRLKSTLAAEGRTMPPDSPELERQVLDNLIAKQLILAKATTADKVKGKVQFEKMMENIKKKGHLTDKEFNQRLQEKLVLLGMSKKQWEKMSVEQATLPAVLERELHITVTDAQAKKFYQNNPGKFERPEMVHVAHILLSTRDPATGKELSAKQKAAKKKEMESILKKARSGVNFTKLVKKYSEDPGSKDRGGQYTFARGQMAPAFEAAAFSLKTNQISGIVTTPYGYHIIKLLNKIPPKKFTFAESEPDIKQYLAQEEMQKQLPGYIAKLKKAADVKILDPKLAAAKVPSAADAAGTNGNMSADDSK